MHIYFDGICIGGYLYDVGKYNPSSNPHGGIFRKSGTDRQQDGNGERGVFLCELAYNTYVCKSSDSGRCNFQVRSSPLIPTLFAVVWGGDE